MKISKSFNTYCYRELISRNRSLKTVGNYKNTRNILIKFFGDLNMTDLTFSDVDRWRDHLLSYQSSDTLGGNLTRLRCVLRMLKRLGYDVIDYSEISVPIREKRCINYLTYDEFLEFLAVVSRSCRGYKEVNRLRNIAIVKLLFYSGLRVSELCSLDRSSIHDRSFIVLGKSKNIRTCYINSDTEISIFSYLACRSDNNPALFITSYGSRMTPDAVRRFFRFASSKSRFGRVYPHMLRHSFATHLLDRDVDLIYISDLLGHESLETTKIYTHYKNTKLQQIYNKVMV